MKNYDDLQRFKEKTQTLGIAFKDMSGQLQEPAENSQWALIRQLANEDASTPFAAASVSICRSRSRCAAMSFARQPPRR